MLGCTNKSIPVLVDIFWRSTNFCNHLGDQFGWHHFDGVPRANQEFVRIGFLLWNMDTNLATDAAFQVDFAPALIALQTVGVGQRFQLDAVYWADLQARLAASAVIRVDNRQLLGHFFANFLGHDGVSESGKPLLIKVLADLVTDFTMSVVIIGGHRQVSNQHLNAFGKVGFCRGDSRLLLRKSSVCCERLT